MRRAALRRRRAIQWDMVAGIALIMISAAMLAAMPWFFQTLGGL
jgi:hypothetical protein